MPKTNKPRLPTTEQFLAYYPQRQPYEWTLDEEQRVCIQVPKFQHSIGKKFCKIIKKENKFTARLDEIGSIIWQHTDGKKTVKDILQILQKQFTDQDNIDQRLYLFLQQMHHLNYITLYQSTS